MARKAKTTETETPETWQPEDHDDSPPRERLQDPNPPKPDPATHDKRHQGGARVTVTRPTKGRR